MSLAQVTASTKATLPPGVPTFTCPIRDGFYAIPGACTSDYYTCIDSSPYVLVDELKYTYNAIIRMIYNESPP